MIGETVSHYRILSRLGSGGMGVIYEAEDILLHRHVALKFLPDDLRSLLHTFPPPVREYDTV
jgi:eukaryotic-like serine/threonine-protein kinase